MIMKYVLLKVCKGDVYLGLFLKALIFQTVLKYNIFGQYIFNWTFKNKLADEILHL